MVINLPEHIVDGPVVIQHGGGDHAPVLNLAQTGLGPMAAQGRQQPLEGIAQPRVALLNIGEEEIKGNDLIKQTHQLLKDSALNYTGYIEGDGIFKGEADVVVCDGFVGNVALKTSEGVAKMMAAFIKEEIGRNWLTKLTGAIAYPVWRGLKHKMNPANYNGASLVGLTGIVIKSHGSADVVSFAQAVSVALKAVEQDIPSLIADNMTPVQS